MEQGYSQREAAKISGVAQTKLSRLKKSGAIIPDLPDGKYSAELIDKIRAEYGKPVSADNSPVDAQEAAQATEMPADEQTPAADETPAQVADFVSDNQSADVPVDGEKKSPVMETAEKILDNKENNSEADNSTSAAEIQSPSPTVDIEKFALINKISAGTLSAYGFLTVTKYSNKNRGNPSRFKCPFCGSHELTPYEGGSFVQWRCDCFGDDFKRNEDLLAKTFGLDVDADKAEIYRRVKEKMPDFDKPTESMIKPNVNVGMFADDTPAENNPTTNGDISIEQQIIDDLDLSKGEFEKLSDKDKRGIRDETAQRLSIGAILNWRHPKMPNSTATPRVIFPLGDTNDPPSYNAVMTDTGRQKFEQQNKAKIKWADKCLSAGTKFLFNPAALENRIVFVTEGEFDAASILQATEWKVGACALGGARLYGDLQKRLSRMKNPPMIIVMLDRDAESQTGQKAAPELVEKLTAMHVPAVAKFFEDVMIDDEIDVLGDKDGKVDANQILKVGGDDALKSILDRILADAVPELERLAEQFKADRDANINAPSPDIPVGKSKQFSHDKELPSAIQKIVDAVNNSLTRENVGYFLDKAKKRGHICPKCGNGSGTKGTGLDFKATPTPPRVVCHCGFSANALKLFAMKNHLSLTGKDFFSTVRAAADFFKVKYDPKTFEFTPQPVLQEQWENIFADYVTDADKPATDNPAVSDFEFTHGKIAPQMWPELIGAKNFLDGLSTEKITAELAQSSKVKRAVALCQFYDFNATAADNFCNRLMAAKSAAAAQVTDWKNNGGLTAPPDDDVQSLAKFTLSDWKKTVNEVVTQIKRRQKHVVRALRNHEISEHNQQVQSERDEAARAAAEKQKSRFAELKALPPSPERDAEIVAQICVACDWQRDKDDMPVAIKSTAANANLIFSNDPALDGVIGFDEFQQAQIFLKRPSWKTNRQCVGKIFGNADAALIRFYLRETYTEFGNVQTVDDAIIKFSRQHSFHPVKQYLKSLPKWDGKPRAETIFIDFLGVKDTPYSREITRKWLLAAVARIFFPGCHFQSAIVLKGNQGIGKSFILERMGGKWYNTISDSVDDSHAVDAIQNTWIGEFKEMKSLRKADINAIKAFIDTSADNRRPAYGKTTERFERHIVFAATTNDEHFLKDVTGNRRFWILECGNERGHYVKGLTDEFISQVWAEVMIWAEALKRFDTKTGEWICDEEQLELSAEMKRQVENVAENFMIDDGLAGEISGYLDQLIPPTVIWELLTPEQRRKFIADGNLYVSGGLKELEARIKNRQYKKTSIQLDIAELRRLLSPGNEGKYFRNCGGVESKDAIVLRGTNFRQHVFASEVYNEHFPPADKRRMMFRIHEVLANLEGWRLGERIDRDPAYGCQKKVYYRDSNPDDTDNPPDKPADDERADAQIEPPAEKSKLDEKLDEFVGDEILEDPPF